jgi:hypothetical protein
MRQPDQPQKPEKPRARVKKADNRPSLFKRIRFWIWQLKNK